MRVLVTALLAVVIAIAYCEPGERSRENELLEGIFRNEMSNYYRQSQWLRSYLSGKGKSDELTMTINSRLEKSENLIRLLHLRTNNDIETIAEEFRKFYLETTDQITLNQGRKQLSREMLLLPMKEVDNIVTAEGPAMVKRIALMETHTAFIKRLLDFVSTSGDGYQYVCIKRNNHVTKDSTDWIFYERFNRGANYGKEVYADGRWLVLNWPAPMGSIRLRNGIKPKQLKIQRGTRSNPDVDIIESLRECD